MAAPGYSGMVTAGEIKEVQLADGRHTHPLD
jgi:hypothetical protein